MRARDVLLLLAAGSSLACAGLLHRDRDKDGFRADEDCDDENPDAHPGAVEVCDDRDVDEDCNGAADDQDPDPGGLLLWYADLDGDGWGDRNGGTHESCDPPAGFAAAGDCDDDDPSIHPEAAERCDEVDQDCDGEADEDPVDGISAWTDADGDGYGDGQPVVVCEAGAGTAEVDGDCDDDDADVSPDAEERCNGVDDDCDGDTDDEDDDVDPGETVTWYRDGDDDGWGDAAATTESCAQPDGYVADDTDCDDDAAGTNPGAEELCGDGVDQDCNGTAAGCGWDGDVDASRAGAVFSGASDGGFGTAVARLPDTDGDGVDEVAIGDWLEGESGAVYTWDGSPRGSVTTASATGALVGNDAGEGFGLTLGAGDLDGDGRGDLVVGTSMSDLASATNIGAGWVFEGPIGRGLDTDDAVGARYNSSGLGLGAFAVSPDLDGDGDDELLVPSYDGVAYVLKGPLTGTSSVTSDDDLMLGDYGVGGAGYWVCPGGDVDADGQEDLVLGGTTGRSGGTSSAGVVYLALGPFGGNVALADMDGQRNGVVSGEQAGRCHPGGDLDGDGYTDTLVATTDTDGGPTYLLMGPWTGTGTYASAAAQIDDEGGHVGYYMDVRGDADGDGRADLLLSGNSSDASDGGAFVFYGGSVRGNLTSADADASFTVPADSIHFGSSVAWVDADGDGLSDALVGDSRFGDPGGWAFLYYAEGI